MPEAGEGRARRYRLGLWLGIAFIVAGLALFVVWGALKVRRVYTCADSTLTRVRFLQGLATESRAAPGDLGLAEAGAQLHGLQEDLVCLRTEVGIFLPLAPLLGWLPEVGVDVANAPALFDMAQALVDAGVSVFDELGPLVAQVQTGAPSALDPARGSLDLPQAVAVLKSAQPSLAAADARLQHAQKLQAGLSQEEVSPRLGQLLETVRRYLPLLRTAIQAGQIAPELLGVEGKRTYLILAQNDDERRPTGGWISGMGLLTVRDGEVDEISFQDSWSVDNLAVPHDAPPDSMYRTLWAEMWLFRDANWSPDFPASAQVAERILARDQGLSVDGVIAVDQQVLRALVAAMEPLDVESSEEPITGANVLSFIRDSWTEPEEGLRLTEGWAEWTAHRKDFMPDLVAAMMTRVQTQPQSLDLVKLASAIWQGLRGRHILVYLHHPESARLLAAQGWDGAILESAGDYLQVVDANVGFNKVDPHVQRSISYHVDLTKPAQARAETTVRYENWSQREVETCLQEVEWLPTYQQRMHGCYWNYVRFLAPEGARPLTREREPLPQGSLQNRYQFAPLKDAGPDTVTAEKAKVAFGIFFVLPPGEQKDVSMAWQLPAGLGQDIVEGRRYRLLVQKQSGAPAIPLQVTVALPPGSQLVDASPLPAAVEGDTVIFDLSLDTDQVIELVFQADEFGRP
jgi:hypothetical protein